MVSVPSRRLGDSGLNRRQAANVGPVQLFGLPMPAAATALLKKKLFMHLLWARAGSARGNGRHHHRLGRRSQPPKIVLLFLGRGKAAVVRRQPHSLLLHKRRSRRSTVTRGPPFPASRASLSLPPPTEAATLTLHEFESPLFFPLLDGKILELAPSTHL